jgi:hypothetical protein
MILSPFSPVCVSLFLCSLALRFSVFLSFSVLIVFSVSLVLLLMLLRLLVVILSSYDLVPLLSCSCVLLVSCLSLSLSSCFLVIRARPLHGTRFDCYCARPFVLLFAGSFFSCPLFLALLFSFTGSLVSLVLVSLFSRRKRQVAD